MENKKKNANKVSKKKTESPVTSPESPVTSPVPVKLSELLKSISENDVKTIIQKFTEKHNSELIESIPVTMRNAKSISVYEYVTERVDNSKYHFLLNCIDCTAQSHKNVDIGKFLVAGGKVQFYYGDSKCVLHIPSRTTEKQTNALIKLGMIYAKRDIVMQFDSIVDTMEKVFVVFDNP